MNLEQQKIILTKQLEDIQEKINYYGLDKISEDAGPFKELLLKRDSIKYQIEEIKKKLDNLQSNI